MKKEKIIIIGAGFGGIYTTKHLAKTNRFDITLIDKNNYFLFTPLLHEVASGNLNAEHVITPIRQAIGNSCVDFYKAEIKNIDIKNKTISCPKRTLEYDYLVLATGAKSTNPTWTNEHVLKLKTLDDAIKIKNKIIDSFEQGIEPSIAIIGGGATGVELTAEIAEFVYNALLPRYRHIKREGISIYLINRGQTILKNYSIRNQKNVIKYLKKINVDIRFDSAVDDITGYTIKLTDKSEIKANIIINTTGVIAKLPDSKGIIKTDKRGRGELNNFLQLESYPEVFILGDSASGSPMDAQVAVQQATVVSHNIINSIDKNKLISFNFISKGTLASIGSKYAIGEIKGISISGRWVWFLWRTIYLFKMISVRKQISTALNWTLNLFTERDISKIG